jgi:5-carboxymethyl-2-hydroxymuconate isomerase
MPILSVEITKNLSGYWVPRSFLTEAHQIITEVIDAKLADCKSRVLWHDTYLVGDGSENNAFVLVKLEILPGRTDQRKKLLAEALTKTLKEQLTSALNDFNIQISVHVRELDGVHYYKS